MARKIFIFVVILLLVIPHILAFDMGVKYESGITCTPNKLYCDDDQKNILKCVNEGDNKILYQNCSKGCEYTGDSAKCNEEVTQKLKNDLTSLKEIVLFLSLILITIIVILLIKRRKSS